jgi:hypothetical protein
MPCSAVVVVVGWYGCLLLIPAKNVLVTLLVRLDDRRSK